MSVLLEEQLCFSYSFVLLFQTQQNWKRKRRVLMAMFHVDSPYLHNTDCETGNADYAWNAPLKLFVFVFIFVDFIFILGLRKSYSLASLLFMLQPFYNLYTRQELWNVISLPFIILGGDIGAYFRGKTQKKTGQVINQSSILWKGMSDVKVQSQEQ